MRRSLPIIVTLIAAAVIVVYITQRRKDSGAQPQAPHVSETATNTPYLRPQSGLSSIRVDAEDPEFAQRVLPAVREFFAALDRADVNPLKDQPLSLNAIRVTRSPNATAYRFLIGDAWTATYVQKAEYSGIIHFGQRGPDNPFRAISHANTNALARLSRTAIKMSQPEAEQILNRAAAVFDVDTSKYEKPEIYPQKMFDYDLGLWTVQYRKKGKDPVNQLNYVLNFSIRATSPRSAVLVDYSDSRR